MSSKSKLLREQEALLVQTLAAYGVRQFTVGAMSRATHRYLDFEHGGVKRRFYFAASTDWKARMRNRSNLRKLLEDGHGG